MARFINVGALFGRDNEYLNCDSVILLYPVQAYADEPRFAIYVVRNDGGEYASERYYTLEAAKEAASALVDRLERGRS